MDKNNVKLLNSIIFKIFLITCIFTIGTLIFILIMFLIFSKTLDFSSISELITLVPTFFNIGVPSVAIISGILLGISEVLNFFIKTSISFIDVAFVMSAVITSITQIFIMAFTLEENQLFHDLYAFIYFIFLFIYSIFSLLDNRKIRREFNLNNENSIYNSIDMFRYLIPLQILMVVSISIAGLLYFIFLLRPGFVNSIFPGFRTYTIQFIIFSIALFFCVINIVKVSNLKTLHLLYIENDDVFPTNNST